MPTARSLREQARRLAVRAFGHRIVIALDPVAFGRLEDAARGRAALASVVGASSAEVLITLEGQVVCCLVGALRLRLRPVRIGEGAARELVATLPRDVGENLRARARELGLSKATAAAQLVAAYLSMLAKLF